MIPKTCIVVEGQSAGSSQAKVATSKQAKVKEWVCEVCDSRLGSWDTLKKHRRNLHGMLPPKHGVSKIVTCDICQGKLCHQDALKTHKEKSCFFGVFYDFSRIFDEL